METRGGVCVSCIYVDVLIQQQNESSTHVHATPACSMGPQAAAAYMTLVVVSTHDQRTICLSAALHSDRCMNTGQGACEVAFRQFVIQKNNPGFTQASSAAPPGLVTRQATHLRPGNSGSLRITSHAPSPHLSTPARSSSSSDAHHTLYPRVSLFFPESLIPLCSMRTQAEKPDKGVLTVLLPASRVWFWCVVPESSRAHSTQS